jgi:hypothetical protein
VVPKLAFCLLEITLLKQRQRQKGHFIVEVALDAVEDKPDFRSVLNTGNSVLEGLLFLQKPSFTVID